MEEWIILGKIQISTTGIKKALKRYDYLQAIAEYIWNGFDAQATRVELSFAIDEMSAIYGLKIKDNGYGINKSELKDKFIPFLESEKQIDPKERRTNSNIRGKNGIGRLTFFRFASDAIWETVYERENRRYTYQVVIKASSLDDYAENEELEVEEPIGTVVSFSGIIDETISPEEVKNFLKREFGWYLELNRSKRYSIIVDEEELDYSTLIADRETITITQQETDTTFECRYVQWLERINNEFSRYYILDSKGNEKYKKATSLNNKGDAFYHSVFIQSSYFDDADFGVEYDDIQQLSLFERDAVFKFLMGEIIKFLGKKRKPYLREYTNKLITDYESNKVFPKFSDNLWDKIRKQELETLVRELYQVQPKLFLKLNIEQKRIFVRLLNLIIDSGENERLFAILEEIVDLDEIERAELADTLKVSKLSSIIQTIKLIEDRYKAIEQLKSLVFNTELKANEVDHVQKFIEGHYWIFGEQYHLVTAAEPNFEEALRRYTYLLNGEKVKKKVDHPDKRKQMDIFMVRQDKQNDTIKNIVIELKSPSADVKLGKTQLDQVYSYMGVILKQDQFNAPNMTWEFYLVGNRFDKSGYIEGQLENAKNHGERSLVFKSEKYKIYVKTWSELFNEFELKHQFINDKLHLERNSLLNRSNSAEEIIRNMQENTATQSGQMII